MLAGEQPAIDVQHALPPTDPPPFPEQRHQPSRQHRVAIPSALPWLDPQQHALAVDVAHLKGGDLSRAQTRTKGDRQHCLMLQARNRLQQPRHLVLAQHHRQLALVPHSDQLARQFRSVERLDEEESQRRDNGVHGRRRNGQVTLLDLEVPHILRRCRVRRTPQER